MVSGTVWAVYMTGISAPAVDFDYPETRIIEAGLGGYTRAERSRLMKQAQELLAREDAILVAHYYTHPDLQELADSSGGLVADSLEMARFGSTQSARTLVVAGVRFMGETAKILNPEKRILMPSLEAECSLDLGCPIEPFSAFCDEHLDRTVVVYANTSAAVKARADWVVTSSCAVRIISHLMDQEEKILWAPDRHLGHYLQRVTGADMALWQGHCVVHDEFKSRKLGELISEHPEAAVLVHPESPEDVIDMADVVGSTTALIQACQELPHPTFIVATDRQIFHKMQQAAPGRNFIEAPTGGEGATCKSCAHCPWMAMNDLTRLIETLETGSNEIHVDEDVRRRALRSTRRMIEFTAH